MAKERQNCSNQVRWNSQFLITGLRKILLLPEREGGRSEIERGEETLNKMWHPGEGARPREIKKNHSFMPSKTSSERCWWWGRGGQIVAKQIWRSGQKLPKGNRPLEELQGGTFRQGEEDSFLKRGEKKGVLQEVEDYWYERDTGELQGYRGDQLKASRFSYVALAAHVDLEEQPRVLASQ